MKGIKYSWVLNIIDRPPRASRAMGVYLTLLYLRWIYRYNYYRKPEDIVNDASQWFYNIYPARDKDREEAFQAGRDFVKRLSQKKEALKYNNRKHLLDKIEAKLYNKFEEAFKRYLKLNLIPPNMRCDVVKLLKHLKQSPLFRGEMTPAGTLYIYLERSNKQKRIEPGLTSDLIKILQESGLAVIGRDDEFFFLIIPAPSLSDEVLCMIASGSAAASGPPQPVTETLPSPLKCVDDNIIDTKEILEKIAASALKHLGFRVKVNTQMPDRSGGYINVDVWGEKGIFKVYVSCKNWDNDIGRPIIDQELGRTANLMDMPHLKVIVAKSLTDDAEKAALANGFLVIKLRTKATKGNAEKICGYIYKELGNTLASIVPPGSLR